MSAIESNSILDDLRARAALAYLRCTFDDGGVATFINTCISLT
jgi:hypothetical protein